MDTARLQNYHLSRSLTDGIFVEVYKPYVSALFSVGLRRGSMQWAGYASIIRHSATHHVVHHGFAVSHLEPRHRKLGGTPPGPPKFWILLRGPH